MKIIRIKVQLTNHLSLIRIEIVKKDIAEI